MTRWDLSIALLEKEEDLAKHASGRDSGMIHPDLYPASRRSGSQVEPARVLLSSDWEKILLPLICLQGWRNGVSGFMQRKAVQPWNPTLLPGKEGHLWLPTAGIISPYKLTIAYAENAVGNGAAVFFNTWRIRLG